MRKLLAYLLTCTSLATMNYLIISYSFVKNDLIQNFQMDQVDVGIADSMRMIGGVTGLLIFTFNTFIKQNYVIYYAALGVTYALLFGSIPILYYLDWRTKYVIFVINLFTGLVKAPTWPLMLQIINNKQYYDQNVVQDKWKMIVWSALTNLGSIAALIFSNIIVYSFYCSWTVCLFFGSGMVIIFSVLVGIFFYQDSQKRQNIPEIKKAQKVKKQQKFQIKDSIFFLAKFMWNFQTCSFIICYMLTQEIQQIYAMFLPLFLNDSGYDQYKGYISSGFIICRVIGALAFSLFANSFVTKTKSNFENQNQFIQNQNTVNNQFKQPKSFQIIRSVSIFLLMICSILLTIHQLDKQTKGKHDILIYTILISFSGLFLGGPMSQLQTFQMLDVINQNSKTQKSQNQMIQNSNFQESIEPKSLQQEANQKNLNQSESQNNQKSQFKAQLILGFIQVFNYVMLIPLLIICGKILQIDIQFYFLFIMSYCVFLCLMDLMRESCKSIKKQQI